VNFSPHLIAQLFKEYDIKMYIIVTRNLDARCLLSKMGPGIVNTNKMILGNEWDTPFANKAAVLIRKGGGCLLVRAIRAIRDQKKL